MTTATRPTTDANELVPAIEHSREISFQQGSPCVYEPEDEPGIIVTEWPNGVGDHDLPEMKTRTRRRQTGRWKPYRPTRSLTLPHSRRQEA